MRSAEAVILVCVILLGLNVNLVHSLDFGEYFDDLKRHFDTSKLQFDFLKLQSVVDDVGGKFKVQSPGYLDYGFLTYDVVKPIGGYFGYIGETLTRKEMCKQLVGAGTGFVGSVGGSSIGSYVGTLILPGYGTLVGGIIGGNVGYKYAKVFGSETVGESICY